MQSVGNKSYIKNQNFYIKTPPNPTATFKQTASKKTYKEWEQSQACLNYAERRSRFMNEVNKPPQKNKTKKPWILYQKSQKIKYNHGKKT